jgi:hypothetical protein
MMTNDLSFSCAEMVPLRSNKPSKSFFIFVIYNAAQSLQLRLGSPLLVIG